MIGISRKKSIAFFIALGALLVVVTLLFYIGSFAFDWRAGLRLFLGIVLLAVMPSPGLFSTLSFWFAKSAAMNSMTRSSMR